jgi:crotonobetainyl-CoA:carnitine CoA-transferase CaiB-like acyl-CoA transferase
VGENDVPPIPPGPLDGVRILDLTTMISGPIATMMLADQGADVIKVESLEGDLVRELGANRAGASATFLSANRSKRSLAIDLKSPAGLAALQKLIPSCDVFIQNFRPGAIERMGLGEAAVRKLRPDVVYVSNSGFGQRGPYARFKTWGPIVQAVCGLALLYGLSG